MAHDRRLFDDTSPQVAALLVQHWRETPPVQKFAQMQSLNAATERLALAGLALQYPHAAEGELRRRLYERYYGNDVVARIVASNESFDERT